jgi:hypothetical protein
MQHVAGLRHPFFAPDCEANPPAFHERDLLVRMFVRRSYDFRGESQAADHQVVPDYHLAFDSFIERFNRHVRPVEELVNSVEIRRRE